jgi:hypothetical protein
MGKKGVEKKSSTSKSSKKSIFNILKKKEETHSKEDEPEFLKGIDLGIHEKEVEPELRLWLSDGRVIKNIEELYKAVKNMKNNVYNEHVSSSKNEFADWVGEILGQESLASELAKANKKEAADVLKRFVEKSKSIPLIPEAEKLIEQKELPAPKNLEEAIAPEQTVEEAPVSELKTEEMRLLEEEAALNREEREINAKRLEVSRKRYTLIKKRGELEKRKFQEFLTNYSKKEMPASSPKPIKDEAASHSANREHINELICQAHELLKLGRVNEAMGLFQHVKSSIGRSPLSDLEKKKIEYDLLGLETELKLAAL